MTPRIAIAHDYLTQRGGAERVVLAMHRAFPQAPIYTTLYDPSGTYPEFGDADIRTSWLNRVPRLRRDHRLALPLLPAASNSLHVDADIVVVSSSGWAHGFPTSGRRLVYCYSPPRWVYMTDTYLGTPAHTSAVGLAMLGLRPALRRWDQARAKQAQASGKYLAISTVVRERIRHCYGFDAEIVPAPHSYDASLPQEEVPALADWAAPGYHLVVSRLLPYKNVAQVLQAFAELPQERLVVVGRGPQRAQLEAARPDNVRMLEGLTDGQMRWLYAHCTALVAPSYEDFGLTPLEAAVYGKPSLTLRGGGFLDTIQPGVSGSFFDQPTPEAIRAAVADHAARRWDPHAITASIERFTEAQFAQRLRDEVAGLAG